METGMTLTAPTKAVDWRANHWDHDEDPDDELMEQTPQDVIDVLGFDPLELEEDEQANELLAGLAPVVEPLDPEAFKTHNALHAAAVVLRGAQLIAVGNWIQNRASERIERLEAGLAELVLRVSPVSLGAEAKLPAMFDEAERMIQGAFLQVAAETGQALRKVLGTLRDRAVREMKQHHGLEPNPAIPRELDTPVLGATLAEHFEKMTSDTLFRFKAAIRAGVAGEDTIEQMLERVQGTPVEEGNEFVEEDHPRAEAGTSEGGQFVSKEGGEAGTPVKKSVREKQTKTPEFKAWFGDSKVVDEDGKPLVVYHGTKAATFSDNAFTLGKTGSASDPGWFGKGIYFTDNLDRAETYAGKSVLQDSPHVTGSVHSVFLSMRNPLRIPFGKTLPYRKYGESVGSEGLTNWIKEQGYDGVIVDYSELGRGNEYVVFSPTQIKSAIGNRGTFSKTDPDITNESANISATALSVLAKTRLFDATENSFAKVIQSAIQSLANELDTGLLDALPGGDVTGKSMGWQWLAVLDNRTCPVCEFYDGNQWTKDWEPVGDAPQIAEGPPAHYNCRCKMVAVDLDETPVPRVKEARLEKWIDKLDRKALEAAVGPAVLRGYERGELSATELIGRDDWELSPDDFSKIKAAWEGT